MPYLCGRTIDALWSISESDNAWVWVNGLGWRKLDTRNTRNLLIAACREYQVLGHAEGDADQGLAPAGDDAVSPVFARGMFRSPC